MSDGRPGEQLALIRGQVRRTRPTQQKLATERPIARVAVDMPLAHLDRPFDYTVPEKFDETCVPGARIRVRFSGQELDGFVLSREETSDHDGRLMPIRRVVSPEPVLAPEIVTLARAVADRYAGTLADVVRLAVPPRHARVEKEERESPEPEPLEARDPGAWASYRFGPEFLEHLGGGEAPRAVWTALPGEDWAECFALAAAATLRGGRGVLLVVPDQRDVARLDAACTAVLGSGHHVALTADVGPAERYRRFLAVRRGRVQCVIGTRAAMFAPVRDLGLVACWDDGDDLHAEPRAPYPHVRDVLLLRAHQAGLAAVIGSHACTAEAAQLVATGWARPLQADRTIVRDRAPRVAAVGESETELARDPAARAVRLPHKAFEAARSALEAGPVLIQVPRAGYLPALACNTCRRAARCATCAGPLRVMGARRTAACGWCGRVATAWRCPSCRGTGFRAPVVGSVRTAEELGRAFPRVPVRTSGGQRVLDSVGPEPALVVATPGAEPRAENGFAAALLLDTWLVLGRADLRAEEEAVRRWTNAAALVRPAREGGQVVIVGDPGIPAIQALVRWSPAGFAERELAARRDAGFPPAMRLASLEGAPEPLEGIVEALRSVDLPASAEVFGPVPLTPPDHEEPDGVNRLVVRAPRADGAALSAALKAAQAIRTARKADGVVRLKIDPHEFG